MRFLSLLLLLPLALGAQGSNAGAGPRQHVRLQVEAGKIMLPLSVTIKGKDRSTVDARVDAIRKELEKRFADQPGWELRETFAEFARAEARSYAPRSGNGSKLFGDDEDKADATFVANARWELITEAEKGVKGLEVLRVKAADLTKPKSEDEKQTLGDPQYVLNDPEEFRNELLDLIKADFEEAQKHLPEGQHTLEITGLAGPINVTPLGGKRFELSLPYRMSFLTPKPEKAAK
jgi:hypothetical protein